MLNKIITAIETTLHCKAKSSLVNITGGCINQAYCLNTNIGKLFIKYNIFFFYSILIFSYLAYVLWTAILTYLSNY